MSEARLRDELCRVGRSLHARGYVHGTTGNLSARLHDGFLISATDACLGDLDPASLVRVDAAGHAAPGAGQPSKTLALHRRIYAAAAEAGCIVHTHSRALVALSLAIPAHEDRDDLLAPITPYFVMKVGHVPLLAYARPGDPAVADRVAAAIEHAERLGHADPRRHAVAARPERLGRHAGGGDGAPRGARGDGSAVARADPKPAPLSPEQIDELRRSFGARW
jgi:ribulose-5-phosphate 4-epimerase/fuculose-1-phosphate aldolase